LPVILSDIPAHREMVTHGRNGFLVAGEDTREMARRVLTLRDDAELRKRAVEAARESARQYDWDRTAERYADTYREVMGAVRGKARR
jgi:glycosyltransferase involved in cell wall biosynthesis